MCGILGVSVAEAVAEERWQAAVQAMAWRGPDALRQVEVGSWRFAVARLAITDPSQDQPIWDPAGERLVLGNGALTSAAEERQAFGAALQGGNDMELLLHRQAQGGGQALVQGGGHLAAVLYEPGRDELHISRDRFGEKPLFLLRREGELRAFGSCLASLRALGFAFTMPAEDRARFFRFGFAGALVPEAAGLQLQSAAAGTTRLRAGREIEHWPAPVPAADRRELRQSLQEAVERCARVEVPLGLSLSGGLDSACIAACLRRARLPARAYQFRAQTAPGAERERARQAAAHLDLELCEVDAGAELLQDLPRLTDLSGLPLGDPSILALHAVAQRAAEDGVKVMLAGEGADETFAGYRRHRLARLLPRRGLGGGEGWGRGLSTLGRSLRACCSKDPYLALLEVFPPGPRRGLLRELTRHADLPLAESGRGLERVLAVDRTWYLRHDLLPKLDTGLMAAGIEGRCPFLDPLVQGCFAARQPVRQRLGKRALRQAFAAELPAAVLDGPKLGFGLPLDRWWREDDFLPDLLCSVRSLTRPHLRARVLRRLVDGQRAGRLRLGHGLYLLAAYECWLRNQEDGP